MYIYVINEAQGSYWSVLPRPWANILPSPVRSLQKKGGSIFSLNGLEQAFLREIYYTTEKRIIRFSQDSNYSTQLTVYEKRKDKLSRVYSFEAIRYLSRKRFCWVCFMNV